MGARQLTKRQRNLLVTVTACAALAFFLLGYWAAPARPWVYLHLTDGSYVVSTPSQEQCRAVERAFLLGRGAPLTGGAIDTCSSGGDDKDYYLAPIVRIDIIPDFPRTES